MRVRMLDCEAGTVWEDQGPAYLIAGREYDVPDHVAEKWVSIGLAELVTVPALAMDDNSPRARRKPAKDMEA